MTKYMFMHFYYRRQKKLGTMSTCSSSDVSEFAVPPPKENLSDLFGGRDSGSSDPTPEENEAWSTMVEQSQGGPDIKPYKTYDESGTDDERVAGMAIYKRLKASKPADTIVWDMRLKVEEVSRQETDRIAQKIIKSTDLVKLVKKLRVIKV